MYLRRIFAGGSRVLLRPQNEVERVCFSSKVTPVKMAFASFDKHPEIDKNLPPLIIMHGLFGSKQNWRSISKALEGKIKRKIYAVDARNHGDSPHVAEHGSEYMAEDVKEFMRQEGIPKACIMGHSMGGRSMMYLALKNPELVDRCIVLDISPVSIPRDFSLMNEIFTAMKNLDVSSDLSMAQGRKVAEEQLKRSVEDKATVDFIMLNLRKRPTGEFYWAPNLDGIYNNLHLITEFMEHLSGLTYAGPTMFICGNKSNFVEPSSWPSIQKIFPNAKLHWLDSGHLVHFEQPQKFMELVTQFLK